MDTSATRRLLHNGRVLADDVGPCTAVALEGAHVRWLGDEGGVAGWRDDADEVIDLHGGLVTPAFVDAHVHLAATGLNAGGVDLGYARSAGEALDLLAAHARRHADAVVFGYGWDDADWPDGRFTGQEVDRAVGDRVAYVGRVDAHSAVVSSSLVRRAPQVTALEGWDATGWASREAHDAVRVAVDALIGPPQRMDALRTATRQAAANGIASVHELGAPHLSRLEDFVMLDEIARHEPTVHVARYWGERDAVGLLAPYRLDGLAGDLCCDGAIGSRTAALLAPYADDPAGSGHLYLDAAEVAAHVVTCTRHRTQAGFHAIGDRALETVLTGFTLAGDVVGLPLLRRARHRLEHAELLSPQAVQSIGRLGLHVSVQPAFDHTWGGESGVYRTRLGADRAARMNPYAELARVQAPLAFGSDSPVTPFDPWGAVAAAVRHRTPGQALGPVEAFEAHTRGGWAAAGVDDRGTLKVGAAATYAVWRLESAEDGPRPSLVEQAMLTRPACERTVRDGVDLYVSPHAR